MDSDYNKNGVQYRYIAVAPEKPDIRVLGDNAINYVIRLKKIIANKHYNGDNPQKNQMVSLNGCIERLIAFLFQSYRISQYALEIYKRTSPPPKVMSAFVHDKVLFDFESLLYHGRALLDRITFYLSKQVYNQDCDVFNKLSNVLKNFEHRDSRIPYALKLINESLPAFQGLLIDANNGRKSLRSRLIHKSTTGESTTCAFTIHTLSDGSIIRFDYELMEYPLVANAFTLTKYVSYFTLNIIGKYLEYNKNLKLEDCNPTWENRLIHFSSFVDPTSTGPKFSIVKMNPSGFSLKTNNLKQNIYDFVKKKL